MRVGRLGARAAPVSGGFAAALGLVLYVLAAGGGPARAKTTLQIPKTDPPSPAILGRSQPFSLRVGYTTTEPVIIGEEPSSGHGKPAMNNGEAHRGPGEGELLRLTAGRRHEIAREDCGLSLAYFNGSVNGDW